VISWKHVIEIQEKCTCKLMQFGKCLLRFT